MPGVSCSFLLCSDAKFPFNEERVIPDGVNRDSAIIGGKECHFWKQFFSDLYLRLPEHQVPFQISIHVFISLRQKKYSVYSHISPILTFDKFKPGMFGGFGKIKNLIYFLSIDQSIHQLIVFGCIEHVSVGWVAAVVDDATDCCVLCRYHRRGDLHHLMYSGVPDPLHVPPQRHLPHQRGQGQRGAHRRIGGHGHHRHRQPRNHRRVQEGVVHLTANGGTLREKVIGSGHRAPQRWRRFQWPITGKMEERKNVSDNDLPVGVGKTCTEISFVYLFCFWYIQSIRKRRGTGVQQRTALRDVYKLTG